MPFILLLSLLLATSASAQETKTDPIVLAHPGTGEPGVWTPSWLQRIHLQTDAELQVCSKTVELREKQLDALVAATADLKLASAELKLGLDQANKATAASRVATQDTEKKADRRLVWAVSSTSAAAVALLVAVLVGAL